MEEFQRIKWFTERNFPTFNQTGYSNQEKQKEKISQGRWPREEPFLLRKIAMTWTKRNNRGLTASSLSAQYNKLVDAIFKRTGSFSIRNKIIQQVQQKIQHIVKSNAKRETVHLKSKCEWHCRMWNSMLVYTSCVSYLLGKKSIHISVKFELN